MNPRDDLSFAGRAVRDGHPATVQPNGERLVTLGWVCMVATVIGAMLLAAYSAI